MGGKLKYSFPTTITLPNGSRRHTPEYTKFYYHKNKERLKKYNKELNKNKIPIKLREKILKRDNNECQICGQKEFIGLHHYDGDRKNNSYWNLLTVCPACHRLCHAGHF